MHRCLFILRANPVWDWRLSNILVRVDLCLLEAGKGRSPVTGQSISSMNVQRPDPFTDSVQIGDESTLVKDDKSYLVDSTVMKERLYSHDGFYT